MEDNKETYSTQQAAEMVGVHKNTIFNWIRTGKVLEVKKDWKGYRIWTRMDIENLIKAKDRKKQLDLGLWSPEE